VSSSTCSGMVVSLEEKWCSTQCSTIGGQGMREESRELMVGYG
jgi:hypothetical protein